MSASSRVRQSGGAEAVISPCGLAAGVAPRARNAPAAPGARGGDIPRPGRGAMRVPVVDGEPLARRRVREILSRDPGLELSECADGREAVDRLRSESFELLVLDVDGVLTAGGVSFLAMAGGPVGELKTFHVRDGSALKGWHVAGKR